MSGVVLVGQVALTLSTLRTFVSDIGLSPGDVEGEPNSYVAPNAVYS